MHYNIRGWSTKLAYAPLLLWLSCGNCFVLDNRTTLFKRWRKSNNNEKVLTWNCKWLNSGLGFFFLVFITFLSSIFCYCFPLHLGNYTNTGRKSKFPVSVSEVYMYMQGMKSMALITVIQFILISVSTKIKKTWKYFYFTITGGQS